jgi:hypothetical protein
VPQHRVDPRHQLAGLERLGDVVVGAHAEAEHHVALLAPGGDHDDRDAAGDGVHLERAAHVEAVEAGEQEVEDDQVGALAAHALEAALAVGRRGHREALAGQVVLDRFQDVRFVFDDDDLAP